MLRWWTVSDRRRTGIAYGDYSAHLWGDGGHPRVAVVEHAQSGEAGLALFPCGGEVGAQAAEGFGAGHAAQAAGDLHPNLQRSNVSLGAVVGEGHSQVAGEAQDLLAVAVEPVEQVNVFGSPSPAAVAGVVVGVGRPAGVDELVVAAPVAGQQLRCQLVGTGVTGGRRWSWC